MVEAGFNVFWNTGKEVMSNPHVYGSMQAFGGLVEAGIGAGMTMATSGCAVPLGWPIMGHGLDHFFTGMNTALSGWPKQTVTSHLLPQTGISPQNANLVDNGISIFATLGGATYLKVAQAAAIESVDLAGLARTTTNAETIDPFVRSFDKLKVLEAEKMIKAYLGENSLLIRNQAQDLVLISQDRLRKVRFDFNNPKPHNNPHMYVEQIKGSKWKDSGQIYPADVPHNQLKGI
jgi:hypothetical protein